MGGDGAVLEVPPVEVPLDVGAEKVLERVAVGIGVDEHEARPGADSHLRHRHVLGPGLQVWEVPLGGDVFERSVEMPGEPVVGAAELAAPAVVGLEEPAAMQARVGVRPDLVGGRSGHQVRLIGDVVDDVAADLGQMFLPTGELPDAAPEARLLPLVPLAGQVAVLRDVGESRQVRRFGAAWIGAARLHDVGEVDGCPYFSMEYVEGVRLGDWLQKASVDERTEQGERVLASRRSSTTGRRALSDSALKLLLAEDLEALLNTINLQSSDPELIEGLPAVQKSILNFGLKDMANKTVEESDRINEIRDDLLAALRHYEPRLLYETMEVQRDEENEDDLTIRFVVNSDMRADPVPTSVEFVTEVELDTGDIKINQK